MEFANDLMACLRGKLAPAGNPAPEGLVAWTDLHARLAAAHAAAGELSRQSSPGVNRSGSFANWRAAWPATRNASRPVNPTDLADRKAEPRMEDAIVGTPTAGGRGT